MRLPGIAIGIPFRTGGGAAFGFAPEEAPTLLTAVTYSDTRIDLAWTSNSGGIEDGFSIERGTDGIVFVEIDTVLTGVVVYPDITCVTATLYYYRVRAFKGTIYSDYSNIVSAVTVNSALIAGWKFDEDVNYFSNSMADYAALGLTNYYSSRCYNGKTYIAYQGNDTDPYITTYNHASGTWTAPVKIGTNPLTNSDNHGSPMMLIDANGYIHIFYGCHNSDMLYSKSNNPEDVSAWTAMGSPAANATYPQPLQLSDGTIYLFFRYTISSSVREWWYKTSTNGGTSWSAETILANNLTAYCIIRKGVGDTIHCAFNKGITTADRFNIYYIKYSTGTWKNILGIEKTLPISYTTSGILAYDSGIEWISNVVYGLDSSDNPYMTFTEGHTDDPVNGGPGIFPYKFMKYNSGWLSYSLGVAGDNARDCATAIDVISDNVIDIYVVTDGIADAIGGDIQKWSSINGGLNWNFDQTILYGQFIDPAIVKDYNSTAKLFVADLNISSTEWLGKGYLWGSGGFIKNPAINDTPVVIGKIPWLNGIIYNNPSIVAGKYGNCYQFVAASNHYIEVEHTSLLSFNGGSPDKPFSVTMFINAASTAGIQNLVNKGYAAGKREWHVLISSSVIYLQCFTLNGANAIAAGGPFTTTGAWVFACFTYNGDGTKEGITVYINCIDTTNTRSLTGTYPGMAYGVGDLRMGLLTTSSQKYTGLLDEIKIWNKVLSVPEMTLIMNNDPRW